MKDVFDAYDKQNTGIIKVSSIGKIFRNLGFNPLESDIQRIMSQIDPNGIVNINDLPLIFLHLDKDQMKFPDYVTAFLSIPSSVTDREIVPAFQVFDTENRGVLEADEMLKQLLNIGEPLTEAEAKAFKDNLKIDEQGLFNYTGRWEFCRENFICFLIS